MWTSPAVSRVGQHPPLEALRHQRPHRPRHFHFHPKRLGDGETDGRNPRPRPEVREGFRHTMAGDAVVVVDDSERVGCPSGVLLRRAGGSNQEGHGRVVLIGARRDILEIGVGGEGIIRVAGDGYIGGLTLLKDRVAFLHPTGEEFDGEQAIRD